MDNQKISFTPLQFLAIFLAMTLCGLLFLGTGMLQNVVNTASDTYEEGQATLVASRAEADEKLGEAKEELDAGEEKLSTAPAQLEEAKGKLDAAEIQLAEGQAKLDDAVPQLAAAEVKLADARVELQQGEQKLKAAAGQLAAGERSLAVNTQKYNTAQTTFNGLKAKAKELDPLKANIKFFSETAPRAIIKPELIKQVKAKARAEAEEAATNTPEQIDAIVTTAGNDAAAAFDNIFSNDEKTWEEFYEKADSLKADSDAGVRAIAQAVLAILEGVEEGYDDSFEGAREYVPTLEAIPKTGDETVDGHLDTLITLIKSYSSEATLTEKQGKINNLHTILNENELIDKIINGTEQELNTAKQLLAAGKTTLDAGYRDYADGHATLMTGRATYAAGMQEYSTKKAEFLEGQATLGEGRKEFNSKTDEYNTKLGEYEDGLATWEEGTETYNATKAEVEEQLAEGEKTLETAEVVLGGLGVKFLKDDDAVTTSNNYGIFKIIALVVYAIVGILVTVLAGAAILKKNVLALLTLKSQDVPNSTIVMRLLGFAEIAALAGAAVAIILYATALPAIVKSVGGDAMAAITIPFQMSAVVICVVVAAVSALIGVLIVGSKLPDGAIEL